MFCSKCGNELKKEAFCPKCGTAVDDGKNANTEGNGLSRYLPGMENLVDNVPIFVGALALLLLSLFLIGSEMLQISLNLQLTTTSFTLSIFENEGFLLLLFLAGYIAAAVIMVLPLRSGDDWEKKHFVLAAIMPALGILTLLIVQGTVKGKLEDGSIIGDYLSNTLGATGDLHYLYGMADMSKIMEALEPRLRLTLVGWLFLAVSVAAEVLVLKTAYHVLGSQEYIARLVREKKEQERAKKKEAQTQDQLNQVPTWQRLEMERQAAREKAEEESKKP